MKNNRTKAKHSFSFQQQSALLRVGLWVVLFLIVLFTSDVFAQKLNRTEFKQLAGKCAPDVAGDTLEAIVRVESGFHPYAIAIVSGSSYYPNSKEEALKIIDESVKQKLSFSIGLGQINNKNFDYLQFSPNELLDPCNNLKATAVILKQCFIRAQKLLGNEQASLKAALSCYYSGNFEAGIKLGYVDKVIDAQKPLVPSLSIINEKTPFLEKSLIESPENEHGFMF